MIPRFIRGENAASAMEKLITGKRKLGIGGVYFFPMTTSNGRKLLTYFISGSLVLATFPARSLAAAHAPEKPVATAHLHPNPTETKTRKLARAVHFLSYSQARAVIESFADELPAPLRGRSPAEVEKLWPEYAQQHDREIRGRLDQGEEDSLINLVLFGTSFTRQPRMTAEFMQQPGKERANKGETAKQAAAASESSADDPVVRAFQGRVADFTLALETPGNNERLVYMRHFLEGRGHGVATAAQRKRLRQYLTANFARTRQEYEKYRQMLAQARQPGDPGREFAARSTLFQTRGVSLDTSLMPNFALEQALRELLAKGQLAKASVAKVAIIGPGLDFVDKQEGYDFYPQQTIQPFLVMDSLFRLGLAEPADLSMTTLDISARVNDHLRRARVQASNGQGYVIQLPLESSIHWSPDALAYWKAAGETIGAPAAPVSPPSEVGALQLRAVKIAPQHVLRITPVDLDLVYQNMELAPTQRYDLVIATNMFSYYGQFEQALAMANLQNMIRPGGFLLTNNGLPENVPVALHQIGFSTTAYSDRPSDGDYIVWYQRASEEKKDAK